MPGRYFSLTPALSMLAKTSSSTVQPRTALPWTAQLRASAVPKLPRPITAMPVNSLSPSVRLGIVSAASVP